MNLTIAEILRTTRGKLICGELGTNVRKISTDSRTIYEDDLFVALIGEHFDGHDYLEEAHRSRAIGAVVSKRIVTQLPMLIEVKDTLAALGDIANCYRQKFHLPIIAITGSNGKTTTKDMTSSVLARRFSVFQSKGNYNNQIGIPLRLLQLAKSDQVAVLEIGTNQPGEIDRLSRIVDPTVGVITNIGHSHLELLGSVEGVAREKGSLLEYVDCAILNADDSMTKEITRRVRGHRITFGWQADADVSACNIEITSHGKPSFMLRVHGLDAGRINLPCLGEHNISNALAAAAVGVRIGLSAEEIRTGLENYQPVAMRMQPIECDGLYIINDAYNSNPDSLKHALDFLRRTQTCGRRIAVLGDMLELGKDSERLHLSAGQHLPLNVDLLISVGQRSLNLVRGALGRAKKTISCETPDAAAQELRKYSRSGDVVLIKGSRAMRLERILDEYGGKSNTSCNS